MCAGDQIEREEVGVLNARRAQIIGCAYFIVFCFFVGMRPKLMEIETSVCPVSLYLSLVCLAGYGFVPVFLFQVSSLQKGAKLRPEKWQLKCVVLRRSFFLDYCLVLFSCFRRIMILRLFN